MTDVARDSANGAAQTKRLFLEAADLPRGERSAFLHKACGGDADLQKRVERLLSKHEDADDVLDASPAGILGIDLNRAQPALSATALRSNGQSPVLLTRTARYDLVRQIGEGGFGVVWLAVQREPVRRRVAVKLMRPGILGFAAGAEATRELLGRFERERQALAVMNHPGIARVFEAGTVEEGPHAGQPFFAMEYIHGSPLPAYADSRKLDLRRRAELLAQVCDALHHAHMRGVLHRDLKPANVLVAEDQGEAPSPKVIEFGIAKLLDEAGVAGGSSLTLTREALFIGTPQYAPPEQASGGQVDTRADVYSLGALGYELFVGVPPRDPDQLRDASPSELQRLLRDEEPVHPARRFERVEPRQRREIAEQRSTASSAIRRALKGELGWIICRAMAPEPSRRYQSADALAEDLRRFLAGQPVEAAPPGKLYRARKFAARNRAAIAMAAIVAAALTLGLAVSTYGLWRARAQAAEARRQAEVAEAVNAFFIDDLLAAAVPSAREGQGRDVTVREVLEAASGRLAEASAPGGRLADQPALSAAIGRALGNTYLAIGQPKTAVEHLRSSLERHESLYGPRHEQTVGTVADLAHALEVADQPREAEQLNRRALAQLRRNRGNADEQTLLVAQRLASTLVTLGREGEAAIVLEETLKLLEEAGGVQDRKSLVASRLVRHQRAMQLVEAGQFEAAGDLFRDQLNELRQVLGPDDMSTLATQYRVAKYLLGNRHESEAVALLQDGTNRLRRLAGPAHPDTLESGYLLAEAHLICGRPDAAHAYAQDMRKSAESAGDEVAVAKFDSLLQRIELSQPPP